MKRIRIWADTHSAGIFDEIGRTLSRDETTISESTWIELGKWVLEYDFVIPLSQQERSMRTGTIEELDNKGVSLLKKNPNGVEEGYCKWRGDPIPLLQ